MTPAPILALLAIVPYVGGKSQSGVWQRIINLIPPHETFIEPFAGDAAIARKLKRATRTIVVEKSPAVASNLALGAGVEVVTGCGIEYLERFAWTGSEFVYADPPYLLSTRAGRRYYTFEMTDLEHRRLLRVLRLIPAPVLISGYQSRLYSEALKGWSCDKFEVMTRGHTWATECLWFNYSRPTVLHDVEHVGSNYRERWRIEKRRRNWRARLLRMGCLERAALFSALVDVMKSAGVSAKNGARIQPRPPAPV